MISKKEKLAKTPKPPIQINPVGIVDAVAITKEINFLAQKRIAAAKKN